MEENSLPSRFFKVILAQSLQNGSLQLPKSFVNHHGIQCFPKYACLEVQTGAKWKVKLRKSEGRVWLDKGWREFAEFYSIEDGSFLLFKYQGGSFFKVLIFSKNGSEIIYPLGDPALFTSPTQRDESKVIEIKDEDIDVTSDYDHAWPRKSHEIRRDPLVNRSRKRQVEKSGAKKTLLSSSMKQQLNRTHYTFRRRFLEKAGIFKSKYPHFILYMTPNFISLRGMVHVPSDHFKRYLKKNFEQHGQNVLVFHGSKGRSWRVHCTMNNMKPNLSRFSLGWKKFVEENKLKEGEVCLFEMINVKGREYQVTIYDLSW